MAARLRKADADLTEKLEAAIVRGDRLEAEVISLRTKLLKIKQALAGIDTEETET